jgi:hypothetical protein
MAKMVTLEYTGDGRYFFYGCPNVSGVLFEREREEADKLLKSGLFKEVKKPPEDALILPEGVSVPAVTPEEAKSPDAEAQESEKSRKPSTKKGE